MTQSSKEERKGSNIALVIGLWVIALALILIASQGLVATGFRLEAPSRSACGGTEANNTLRTAQAKAWGAQKSREAAMAIAVKFCSTLAPSCNGNCSNTGKSSCHPAPHRVHEKQSKVLSWRLVDTRTTLEYNCPCICEP